MRALTAALALSLAACAGPATVENELQAALPQPGMLPRSSSDVDTVLTRLGADYLPFLNNRVSEAGSLGHLAPVAGPGGAFTDFAWAGYQFDASGLSGPAQIEVAWHAGGTPAGAFVGLSNWGEDRWEWFDLAAGGGTLALPEFSDYVEPSDGRLYAVVVLGGSAAADLALLRFTFGAPAPSWQLTQLSATPGKVHHLRLFELQGKPAIVYWRDGRDEDPPTSRIVLKRALDPDGIAWAPPQLVASVPLTAPHGSPDVGSVDALVIDGKLTVYYEAPLEDNDGRQIRAIDAAASEFYPTEFVYWDPDPHGWDRLLLVDGRPAYFHSHIAPSIGAYGAAFEHAVDAVGSEWDDYYVSGPTWWSNIRDSVVTGAGNPAMFSVESWDSTEEGPPPGSEGTFVRYLRANGSDPGTAGWHAQVDLFHNNTPFFLEALTLADGRPGFMYALAGGVAWKAALDSEGDSWPVVGVVVPGFGTLSRMEAACIGDRPAVTYSESSPEALYYREAADALGSSWQDAQLMYEGISTESLELYDFGGRPGIATLLPADGGGGYPAFFMYR